MKDALPPNRMTVSAQTECPHCRCDLIVDLVCWFDAGELRVESLDDIPPEDLLCSECADLLSENDYVEDTPTEALSGRQQSAHPTAGRECQFFNVNASDDQYR
jgi:hypothetical protein